MIPDSVKELKPGNSSRTLCGKFKKQKCERSIITEINEFLHLKAQNKELSVLFKIFVTVSSANKNYTTKITYTNI